MRLGQPQVKGPQVFTHRTKWQKNPWFVDFFCVTLSCIAFTLYKIQKDTYKILCFCLIEQKLIQKVVGSVEIDISSCRGRCIGRGSSFFAVSATTAQSLPLSKSFFSLRIADHVFTRVYRLGNGDTVSHVDIFDPALWTVALLTFSLVKLSPLPFPVWISKQ